LTKDKSSIEIEFVSTHQAAKMLNVSARTIQNWIKSGKLKAWKTLGGHNRLKRSEIELIAESQNNSTTGKADSR
jgi:excisionase family DNA binding protein